MTEQTITHDAIVGFSADLNAAVALGQALDISPCHALEMAFPATSGDDMVLEALALMMAPAVDEVAYVVSIGGIEAEAGENFLHNVFHLLQTAAAMGHALGIAQATGPVDVPVDLSDLAWGDLPDVLGDEDGTSSEEA